MAAEACIAPEPDPAAAREDERYRLSEVFAAFLQPSSRPTPTSRHVVSNTEASRESQPEHALYPSPLLSRGRVSSAPGRSTVPATRCGLSMHPDTKAVLAEAPEADQATAAQQARN